VRELLLKYWLVYWRTPSYTLARCFLTLCVAFVYGSMYLGAGRLSSPASMGDVQNIMGILFSSTSFLGMTNLMAAMPLMGESKLYRAASVHNSMEGFKTQAGWMLPVANFTLSL
jgi:hypothetical protein